MVRVYTGVNIRNDSHAGHVEGALSLSHANDLSSGLVHVSMGDAAAVVSNWSCVPQTLRRRRRARLIGVVRRNHQRLIRFCVKYSGNKPEETREKLGQKTLNGLDQEDLVHVAINIADYRAAVGKASSLEPGKAEIGSNDDARLRTEGVGQDLPHGRKQAGQNALGRSWLGPKSDDEKK